MPAEPRPRPPTLAWWCRVSLCGGLGTRVTLLPLGRQLPPSEPMGLSEPRFPSAGWSRDRCPLPPAVAENVSGVCLQGARCGAGEAGPVMSPPVAVNVAVFLLTLLLSGRSWGQKPRRHRAAPASSRGVAGDSGSEGQEEGSGLEPGGRAALGSWGRWRGLGAGQCCLGPAEW